ncbi:MAG: S8 family serine peptidase [Bacteroidales bacterium]|nr:S8 family serine peptidase [Clostridium sp.]MCM1204151.1 S8 family serine peptidase [Bacteroidales bacterium]
MTESKISPELNMALGLNEEEREKSLNLNVGYSDLFEEWELIIRYTGSLDSIREEMDISIEELLGGYAVVRIPQYLIGRLSDYPQIDYIEKPKALLLEEMEGIGVSCINRVRLPNYNLTGAGTLVACLDSGVDFYHPDFRNRDGTTRIVTMWDQTTPGNPPEGFSTGSVYGAEEINAAILAEERRNESLVPAGQIDGLQETVSIRGRDIVPEFDTTGHGTAVLGIMAGNGLSSEARIVGVAPEAEIIVVKLGNPDSRGFPRTTQLMLAIDFAVRYAMGTGKPLAINISFGNNYGSHNGNSILERYVDTVSNLYRLSIVTGTGNDGRTARHTSGNLSGGQRETVEIYVADYMKSFNLQIWKHYLDLFDITIESPVNRRIGPLSSYSKVQNYILPEDIVSVYYSEPTPYDPEQEIYISWIPRGDYITSGIWKIYLEPRRIVSGDYNMWLPVAGSTSSEVSFVRPAIFNTLLIPSTARYVISVAAYDSRNDTFAVFSGRGPSLEYGLPPAVGKPDLAAPGVAINTCKSGGGYGEFSGTSFAAPFVTGAAALLMQYGIVEGRDPYLYGEKIRASLIKGARRLPFQQEQPSPLVGWGALCVRNSLPE